MPRQTRAELHLHALMSDTPSVIEAREILQRASDFGLDAVAFTSRNSVQDFPAVQAAAASSDVQVIYGAEVCYQTADAARYRATLLVKNQDGLKELYTVLSSLKKDGFDGTIDRDVLVQNRRNLLVGSCGRDGELYAAVLEGRGEEAVNFYDYIELFPTEDENERCVYAAIAALGEAKGLPVAAVSNARYLSPDDAVCCDILRYSKASSLPRRLRDIAWPREEGHHLRSPDEMLDAFAYLGDAAAHRAVFDAPAAIAEQIEAVTPLPTTRHYPETPHAKEQVATACYTRAHALYGEPLPQAVRDRLEAELNRIPDDGVAATYLLAAAIVAFAKGQGSLAALRGMGSSMLTAHLLGISEVNPLPPHEHCPQCRYFEERPDVKTRWDLNARVCPMCGASLQADGYNIPFETFTGLEGEKVPDFHLQFPTSFFKEAHTFLAQYVDASRIARAGTVATSLTMRMQEAIDSFSSAFGHRFDQEEKQRLVEKLSRAKRAEGQHPAAFFVLPEGMVFEDFTPLRQSEEDPHDTVTHLDFHSLHHTLLKQYVLGSDQLELLWHLQKETGVTLSDIPLNDPAIYTLLCKGDTEGLPSFEHAIVAKMYQAGQPRDFAALVKMQGLSHGTRVWTDNGEHLLRKGIPLMTLPTMRDDVFFDLRAVTDRETAFFYTECIRKGQFANGRLSEEAIDEFYRLTIPLGAWYAPFCTKVQYMFPKAHAVDYALLLARLAWFKAYHPTTFARVRQAIAREE